MPRYNILNTNRGSYCLKAPKWVYWLSSKEKFPFPAGVITTIDAYSDLGNKWEQIDRKLNHDKDWRKMAVLLRWGTCFGSRGACVVANVLHSRRLCHLQHALYSSSSFRSIAIKSKYFVLQIKITIHTQKQKRLKYIKIQIAKVFDPMSG